MLLPPPLATIRLPSGPDLETTCTHATWSNAVELEMHTAAEASMLSSSGANFSDQSITQATVASLGAPTCLDAFYSGF